ncbi:hypothetical protein JXA84_05290 [candidate division WOR-3 bacterium]|nr:hypothetical protein [candidate division WOR-3 bacterium]
MKILLFLSQFAFAAVGFANPFSGVDLRIKNYYGMIGVGYSRPAYTERFKTGIDDEISYFDLKNYSLSGKAGIYIPWLSKKTSLGFMMNLFYDRYYQSSAFGSGAKSEILAGTLGIDLAVYPFSAIGTGPYFHVLNGFSKVKFNTDFGYDGFSPFGYGVSAGAGVGIPWGVSYPEHLNLSFDFDYRDAGDQTVNTYSFVFCVGGFF